MTTRPVTTIEHLNGHAVDVYETGNERDGVAMYRCQARGGSASSGYWLTWYQALAWAENYLNARS